LLAGRIHSYVDTQISRLGGANFHEIPVNSPVAQVHNNQRDGMHRQAIHRGRVAYEPNSLGGGCPFQAGMRGFTSFPQPVNDDKVRGKPEKFADHYSQATLFWNSQTAVEKAHIVRGFRFELTKVQTPSVRTRMVASLVNVARELAEAVAQGLGIGDAGAVAQGVAAHRSTRSGNVRGPVSFRAPWRWQHPHTADRDPGRRWRRRRNAKGLHAALLRAGAVPRIVGLRLGQVRTEQGESLDVEVTLETGPAVLYDAVAVPGGRASVQSALQRRFGE
jgi:catalase